MGLVETGVFPENYSVLSGCSSLALSSMRQDSSTSVVVEEMRRFWEDDVLIPFLFLEVISVTLKD